MGTKEVFRGGSRTAAISKMEHFVIRVKCSILDVASVLDSPLSVLEQHPECFRTLSRIFKNIPWHLFGNIQATLTDSQYFLNFDSFSCFVTFINSGSKFKKIYIFFSSFKNGFNANKHFMIRCFSCISFHTSLVIPTTFEPVYCKQGDQPFHTVLL